MASWKTPPTDLDEIIEHVDHEGLVVEDQGIWHPLSIEPSLLDRVSGLIPGRASHLSGDEKGPIEEEARHGLLDDLEACTLECPTAGRRHLLGLQARQSVPPTTPEVRVDEDREVDPSEPSYQTIDAGGVVEMTMATD
ncbi:MAG: hypothetical protein E6G01_16230, partial [Actinobacteria bacterium]